MPAADEVELSGAGEGVAVGIVVHDEDAPPAELEARVRAVVLQEPAARARLEMRDSQLLYNEPKWIRMDDGGLHTLEAAGLKLKKGVYY